MRIVQYTSNSFGVPFRPLKHGELVPGDRFIFVDTRLDVPADKITAIAPGKSSGAKPAYGCALPKAIVNMRRLQVRFLLAGIAQRLAQRALPGGFGNVITGSKCRMGKEKKRDTKEQARPA